ncbi:MAG: thiol oxidoreductase, partial [Gammaproteobacteria bacterium]|nr:thiol oxidoreductase [Gammaproteobacteria bacterium]
VQNGGQSTRNKVRTMPLWGLSKRRIFLHDGSSNSLLDAIGKHAGEASDVVTAFKKLSPEDNQQLMNFLNTL